MNYQNPPKNVISCYEELKKLGIAVQKNWGDEHYHEDRGYFWIWCEGVTEETDLHLDYYNNFWGSDELNGIMQKYGMWHEWYNPAYSNAWEE